MANYYKEIYKMLDKTLYKALLIEKKGINLGLQGKQLSFLDIYILKEVKKTSPIAIHDLVKNMNLDRGVLTPIINRLVQIGYLEKSKSEKDKRIYLIHLTESGKDIYNHIFLSQ